MTLRPRALLASALVVALVATACSSSPSAKGSGAGASTTTSPVSAAHVSADRAQLVPMAEWRALQDRYLSFVTAKPQPPGSLQRILADEERARRQPGYHSGTKANTPADYADMVAKLKAYRDTGDFDINDMLFVWNNDRASLPADLAATFRERILAFKYWWTEPTPKGINDSQYYWTENHQIIYLANEYIAGQDFPTARFTNSGMTGAAHQAHARPLILDWIDRRARYGWSEWLSDVYYSEDMKGLLLLAEWSNDAEISRRATMALDLLLFEIASHLENGSFGATHGRSYMKDKMTALDEDTFNTAKLLWNDSSYPFQGLDNAVLLATAHRYRPPAVLAQVAHDPQVSVDRTRAGIPLDPTAPVTANPKAPYGLSFTDPRDLGVWWGMGAQFPWQMVPLTLRTVNKYNLWDTENFQQAADLRPIVESSKLPALINLAQTLSKQLNPGLLSQVDTYTWRSPAAMLSTALDWRPGQRGEQDHIWQATLDANAEVFTTLPAKGVPDGTDWHINSAWWTGDGAMPRSTQYRNVGISIYNPAYASVDTGALKQLGYQPYTHAYFPQDAFDQVVQRGQWMFGRKGNGYVALYSWRPTHWVSYDPTLHPTNGMTKPFELMSEGTQNVWMVEVGQAADWQAKAVAAKAPDPFSAFVDAVAAAPVTVTKLGCPDSADCAATGPASDKGTGFDVSYTSPSVGPLTFGSSGPFSVAGTEQSLHGGPRYDNPWVHTAFGSRQYRITAGGQSLLLDFATGTRA